MQEPDFSPENNDTETNKLWNYVIAGFLVVGMLYYCTPDQLTLKNAGERIGNLLFAAVGTEIKIGPGTNRALSGESVSVPLKADNRALMVDVEVNGREKMTLVLDTGATYTAISKQMAENLGYDLENAPKIWVTTANGRVALPKIKLKQLTLNGYKATDVEATVMNLPTQAPFSGLLGLSFIRNHRITIDTEADNLVIEPRV